MKNLSDILTNSGGFEEFREQWDTTEEADEFAPLPTGTYTAHIVKGKLEQSRTKKTPCYQLVFKVLDGEYVGRRFWHDIWLTLGALPQAKRDLRKLGVTDLGQLDRPLPLFIRVKATVALRRDDDGTEHNRVRRFEVLGIDRPERDDFAFDDMETDAPNEEPPPVSNQASS